MRRRHSSRQLDQMANMARVMEDWATMSSRKKVSYVVFFQTSALTNASLALDQLMTQLMEGGSSTRPVAAPEETVEKLPREVLEEGSELSSSS